MKQYAKSFWVFFIAIIFCASTGIQTVQALDAEEKKLLDRNILYYDPKACDVSGASDDSEGSLVGDEAAEQVFNFFVEAGYSEQQAAGIIGNMSVESGLQPQRLQNTPSGVKTDADSVGDRNIGWGIVQWTPASKMIRPVKDAGKNPDKLLVQLEFLLDQLEGQGPIPEKAAGDLLKSAKNVEDATAAFQNGYERPADRTGSLPTRTAAAKAALKKFGGAAVSTSPEAGINNSSDGSDECACNNPSAGSDNSNRTVVLDPGHSGSTVIETDPETGIKTSDSDNGKETKDMWKASEKIRTKLEQKGFRVITTKESADDSVGLIARAKVANDSKAAIAVSLHSTPGKFGSDASGWVTPQEVGLYRQTGSNKKTFENTAVADKSQEYADKIVAERKKSEGEVKINQLDFPASRGLGATGNISIVQLFSNIPWIYNEVGQSGYDEGKYADGVANGIIAALGGPATPDSGCGDGSVGSGDLSGTVTGYAYPDYKPPVFITPRASYEKAFTKARSEGIYIGGNRYPGIDCGGFVTLLLINSGFEPDYNYGGKIKDGAGNTINQEKWMKENWQKISPKSTKDFEPGDVAINSKHTFVYVGKIDGFNSVIASASLDQRAPMAGKENPLDPAFNWYRKK